MAKKQMLFKTKGMNRDLSVSAFNPEFAFENMNLRLSTNEGNTLLSWVNEKGTSLLDILVRVDYWNIEAEEPQYEDKIYGVPIGTAVINHKIVLFTTRNQSEASVVGDPDYIYELHSPGETVRGFNGRRIFNGNLNFSALYPIETLVSYEAEDVEKVYWVDGRNQPRMINLKDENLGNVENSYFDFVRELQLNETITVQKMLGANGMFAPGVIQYAFTYYTKNGQESCIFYTTPLHYISYKDRGASPEDKVSNAFKITVSDLDFNFDFLRIYSIQRTSINGTPICKRIQDIDIKYVEEALEAEYERIDNDDTIINKDAAKAYAKTLIDKVSYTDTGMSGNSVDPTELLYKGGEDIIAETLEQKDNTLFLGNIQVKRREPITQEAAIKEGALVGASTRSIYPTEISTDNYIYDSQLTSFSDKEKTISTPCAGFKRGDTYRCGVQFQYKTGKWSEPIFIQNYTIVNKPEIISANGDNPKHFTLPTVQNRITESVATTLRTQGYKRVRPVVVFPEIKDRKCLCQGVVCPTMHTNEKPNEYQSSYFFRTNYSGDPYDIPSPVDDINYGVIPAGFKSIGGAMIGFIPYTDNGIQDDSQNNIVPYNPDNGHIKSVEIEGQFEDKHKLRFYNSSIYSFHSPDVEFDTNLSNMEFSGTGFQKVGDAEINKTLADIEIQTESPTCSNLGSGFIHKSCIGNNMHGIVSGLYFDDFVVDDAQGNFQKMAEQKSSYKWMVYPWQGTGSLNNDVTRPAGKGTPSDILKKKIISNLRFSNNTIYSSAALTEEDFNDTPQLFSSDEVSILKLGIKLYKGNIDTIFSPDEAEGTYFMFNADEADASDVTTLFNDHTVWKTFSKDPEGAVQEGLYKWRYNEEEHKWEWKFKWQAIGNDYIDLVVKRLPVRMKYKSTPHLVFGASYSSLGGRNDWANLKIPVIEVIRKNLNAGELFGGTSNDALKENTWIPCGEPVSLTNITTRNNEPGVWFDYIYGDTYYQRWDCLKTYAFTKEDINQVVEIGSFMLETRVNIDGRYDRNRGQQNNLNMSPQNFNLMNPVYSQIDNFFSYKITEDEDENKKFPNLITWTKAKENGADIDLWTNVTLASVLNLDGNKGEVRKLIRLNDQLICFQDKGISQILYNENVQIASTAGVPIEIANSDKVQGERYYSDTIGCSNKWAITATPSGIYFMDNITKSIYLFNSGLKNISQLGGMDSWCKQNIPEYTSSLFPKKWTPNAYIEGGFSNFVSHYDPATQDVLFISKDTCVAWNEKVGAFTSLYSYESAPFFCDLNNTGIWFTIDAHVDPNDQSKTIYDSFVWKHRDGDYCRFFGANKPYWMTLVGNPEPQMDKVFTNLEFRACVSGDGTPSETLDSDGNPVVFTPTTPFDSLETWNEYQHGFTTLENKNGRSAMIHGGDSSALKRKFRIWRCDIPRNNCELDRDRPTPEPAYSEDADLGISRYSKKPMDRMRNPWLYLKLVKNAAIDEIVNGDTVEHNLDKTEIHDVVMTYFT